MHPVILYCRIVLTDAGMAFVRDLRGPMIGFLVVVLGYLVALLLVPGLVASFGDDVQKGGVVLAALIVLFFLMELARAQYMLYRRLQLTAAVPTAPPAPQQTIFIFTDPSQLPLVLGNVLTQTGQPVAAATVVTETGEGSDTTTTPEPPPTDDENGGAPAT